MRPGVDELGPPCGDVRARRHEAGRDRGIKRQDLVLLRLLEEQRFKLLDLLRVLRGDVVVLVHVLRQVVELELLLVERVGVRRPEGVPGRAVDLGAPAASLRDRARTAPSSRSTGCVWREGSSAFAASKV